MDTALIMEPILDQYQTNCGDYITLRKWLSIRRLSLSRPHISTSAVQRTHSHLQLNIISKPFLHSLKPLHIFLSPCIFWVFILECFFYHDDIVLAISPRPYLSFLWPALFSSFSLLLSLTRLTGPSHAAAPTRKKRGHTGTYCTHLNQKSKKIRTSVISILSQPFAWKNTFDFEKW